MLSSQVTWDASQRDMSVKHCVDESVLEPWKYIAEAPGKDIRGQLIEAFDVWLKVPEEFCCGAVETTVNECAAKHSSYARKTSGARKPFERVGVRRSAPFDRAVEESGRPESALERKMC